MFNKFLKYICFFILSFIFLKDNSNQVFAESLIYREMDDRNIVKVPILMYHRLDKEKKRTDIWTITVKEFEKDLIYFRDNAYTPIIFSDLVRFVEYGAPLPDKPIIISFDDGDGSFYELAYPILKKYNYKAVMAIVGSFTDEHSKKYYGKKFSPHLTWSQINEMLQDNVIELQNHSYDLHKDIGAKKKKNESQSQYKNRIQNDVLKLEKRIKEMANTHSSVFVYPFGAKSKSSDKIIRNAGFKGSFSCFENVSEVKQNDPSSLFNLGRYNRTPQIPINDMIKKFKTQVY